MNNIKLTPLPEDFKQMLRDIPGLDAEALITALDTPPAISIKRNLRKDPGASQGSQVPWCSSGHYLDSRPIFTLDPRLHAGAFYVQEAASMIYETIIPPLLAELDIHSPASGNSNNTNSELLVLDACAAPGGKSTSIINALPDSAHLVANEFVTNRAGILRENLLKWGFPNISITNSSVERLASIGPLFSIVAVDAPCSGEGMMRKEPVARTQWSPALVDRCASLQKEILASAIDALLPGGFLIFSTCTFNTVENEQNLSWLVENKGLVPVAPTLPPGVDIPRQVTGDFPALRFFPHITRGEGLFIAILRKPGPYTPLRNPDKSLQKLLSKCKVIADGYPTPVAKGKDLIPDGCAPLNVDFDPERKKYHYTDLDTATALDFLRHNAIVLPPDTPRGIVVVSYKGLPLGLVKNLGSRANNLYPKEWRIKNL